MFLVDQIGTPPALPPYLKKIHDLKTIRGIPEDEEMIQIRAVIRMAEKVVDAPEVGNPMLLYQLTEHLFNVQMIKYRSRHLEAIFPENTTYTPPTLPTHISVSLETITGTPSDEEIIKVQDAIRLYQQFSNNKYIRSEYFSSVDIWWLLVPSMFDPRVSMELSQHLFDLQIAKYTQSIKQNQPGPVPREVLSETSTILVESTAGPTEESSAATNNAGTATDIGVQNAIEQSNRIAEQANLLIERSNQIAERSNQVAERSNQLVERLNLPSEQSNNLTELYERLNQNSERSNQHQERTNYLAEGVVQNLEKLGDILKNINKVLVGIQHAIVRNHKNNTIDALDCLINEKGETPPVNETTRRKSFGHLSGQPDTPDSRFNIVVNGFWMLCHINDDHLGGLLWFYGIGDGLCENDGTQLILGKATDARNRLADYLSSCLG